MGRSGWGVGRSGWGWAWCMRQTLSTHTETYLYQLKTANPVHIHTNCRYICISTANKTSHRPCVYIYYKNYTILGSAIYNSVLGEVLQVRTSQALEEMI